MEKVNVIGRGEDGKGGISGKTAKFPGYVITGLKIIQTIYCLINMHFTRVKLQALA